MGIGAGAGEGGCEDPDADRKKDLNSVSDKDWNKDAASVVGKNVEKDIARESVKDLS